MLKKSLLFILCASVALAFAFKPDYAKTHLSGTVRSAQTDSLLVDVKVGIYQKNKKIAETNTNKKGEFELIIAAGDYVLQCTKTGYIGQKFQKITVSAAKNAPMEIALHTSTTGLDEMTVLNYRPPYRQPDSDKTPRATTRSKEKAVAKSADHRAKGGGEGRESAAPVEAAEVAYMSAPADYGAVAKPVPGSPAPPVTGMTRERTAPKHATETYEELLEDASALATADVPTRRAQQQPRAGLLTAGEWNDLHNWNKHWVDLLADGEIENHQNTYGIYPRQRYTVMLLNEQNYPAADVPVLLKSGQETIWEARTDNTGKAELWAGLFDKKERANLRAEVLFEGKNLAIRDLKAAKNGINFLKINASCNTSKNVDIVWAVDATGSMGDEINYLKTELLDVIGRAKSLNQNLNFRMGTVFYRDNGDDYITKSSALHSDISKTVAFIRQQFAGGGGDTPEAVHSALEEAVFSQHWSETAVARICFLVLDASPHQNKEVNESLQRSIREAAKRGIRIVPVTASGIQKDTEFLMKFFGLATNGSYVFLTDHSGIGEKHLEPTTDEYKVELLNDLLVRIITEYTSTPDCAGKSAIRSEGPPDQQGQNQGTWQVNYFPNPATDVVNLELPAGVQSVTIYNSEGKAAAKLEQPNEGANPITLRELPAGFYTIRVLKDGKQQSGKLLIIRA